MTEEAFTNEYSRALARPDLEELREMLDDAFQWHQWQASDQVDNEPEWFGCIYGISDAEERLALSILAMAEYDDPMFIGFIAAGPLEDIFSDAVVHPDGNEVSETIMARVEVEARRTPRFRWMLSGVWTTSFKLEHTKRIKAAVAGANMNTDPLPARPIA